MTARFSIIHQMLDAQKNPKQYVDEPCLEPGETLITGVPMGASTKSKKTAFFLCLFLGLIGGHCLYVGRKWKAAIFIILTIATTGILSGIWCLWHLIAILRGRFTDATGHPLVR